jgi:hypothetical protein
VFAWSKSDLTRVHRSVIEHAVNTDPKIKPKRAEAAANVR